MRSPLLRKLLLIVVLVIALAVAIVWLAIDLFAADYHSFLMEKYNLPKDEVQHIFLEAAHRYIFWAGFAALTSAVLLSFLLIKRILGPLYQMSMITGKVARGDYTERVRVTSSDEIGELAKSFNRMTDSLQRFEQLRETMVANVAHELRAPLTNMRGYLEALSDGVLPPSRKTFELLHEETLRLAALSDDLLTLSSAADARSTLNPKKLTLREFIPHALDLFRVQFAAKEIAVETQFPDGADEVMADPDKLGQVVHNLLQNVWQYTPRGGQVRVSVEPSPGWVRVTFANPGDGIAEEDLPFIFERFYRGEKSRSREYGGAGIGLAIVKELVEAHGGQVGAESSLAETRIWFTLPR
ncbi:MAG: HAMP domain-containing protein [Acidobacteria bacterium]|nr:HAMP domain-containing protein [Acidobacteriota bacterium]